MNLPDHSQLQLCWMCSSKRSENSSNVHREQNCWVANYYLYATTFYYQNVALNMKEKLEFDMPCSLIVMITRSLYLTYSPNATISLKLWCYVFPVFSLLPNPQSWELRPSTTQHLHGIKTPPLLQWYRTAFLCPRIVRVELSLHRDQMTDTCR